MRVFLPLLILNLITTIFSLHYMNLTNLTDIVYDDTPPKLDPELKNDLDEIEKVKEKSKTVSCMIIVRNSLAKGNEPVSKSIKETTFNKAHVFDKAITLMVENCQKHISESIVEEILTPENVLNLKENYLKLIEFDLSLLNVEPTFSSSELEILKEIHDINKEEEEEKENNEQEEQEQSNTLLVGGVLVVLLVGVYLVYKKVFTKKRPEFTKKKN